MAKDYETYIKELAREHKNEFFYNSSNRHASIVLRELVKNSTKYIKILCDSMCSDVSNNKEYLDLLENFFKEKEDRMIKILFVNYDSHFLDKPIAKLLRGYRRQVEIRCLSGNEQVKFDGKPVHFTVSDDCSFRLETDIDEKMAFGNFNNLEWGKMLSGVFNDFFENGEPVREFA